MVRMVPTDETAFERANGHATTGSYRRRYQRLKDARSTWESHWREVADYIDPYRGRFLAGEADYENDGTKRYQKIIRDVAGRSLSTLVAGMQGGLTSPSRPWFFLGVRDQGIMDSARVRAWFQDVRDAMLLLLSRSNFYSTMESVYAELALFGHAALIMDEDPNTVLRFKALTCGESVFSQDSQGRPSALYRRFAMTVEQLVEEFGLDAVTEAVRLSWEAARYDETHYVYHVMEPRRYRNAGKPGAKDMAYVDAYFLEAAEDGDFLRVGGRDSVPFACPRWSVVASDLYGPSPGIRTLGSVKELQREAEDLLKAVAKSIDPPVNAPSDLKSPNHRVFTYPGGVNFTTAPGSQGVTPLYQVNPNLAAMDAVMARVEGEIRTGLFADLFFGITEQVKGMTATEVSARQQEKFLILGPMLDRAKGELLDVVIKRLGHVMASMGLLPPMPPELEGLDIEVELVSILAVAQRATGITAIEQTVGFVGQLAGANPEVLDVVDFDEAVNEFAKATAVAPRIIRSDEDIAKIRAGRAEAAARAQEAQNGLAAVQGAKLLSDTKLEERTALGAVLGTLQPQ